MAPCACAVYEVLVTLLNHSVSNKVSRTYNRYEYINERKTALDAWAGYVNNLTNPDDDNKVVVLKTARG